MSSSTPSEAPRERLALSDLFPVVAGHLPAPAQAQIERWATLARLYSLETFGCFELGLDGAGDQDPVFDFSIRFKKPREATGLEAAGLVTPLLAELLAYWRDSTEEADPITSVWIEYDLHRWIDGPPEPIFFAQFGFHVKAERILAEFFPLLLGDRVGRRSKNLMERALRELPPGARLLYLSNLRGRGVAGARFELIDLPLHEVAAFLKRLDGGDWRAQVDEAARFHEGNDQFHFSFDVTERIEPRLGFQSNFQRQPARDPRWAELFGKLEEAGLCTPEASRLALSWSGVDNARTAPARWPADGGEPLRGSCFRAISHFKLVSWPDRPLLAKAYLLFGHMPPRVL